MKKKDKVFQRVVGNGRDGNAWGDCMKCAIATLFKLKYEDVPHFIEHDDWHKIYRDFLVTQGYSWYGERTNSRCFGHCGEPNSIKQHLESEEGVGGLFYATVYSPKYYNRADDRPSTHAVLVDKELNIVFDPNPEYQDIEEYPEAKWIRYNGIVSVDIFKKI